MDKQDQKTETNRQTNPKTAKNDSNIDEEQNTEHTQQKKQHGDRDDGKTQSPKGHTKPRKKTPRSKPKPDIVSDKTENKLVGLEFWDEPIDVSTIPEDLFPWEYIRFEPDVIYFLLLHLCDKHPNRVIQRQVLLRLTYDVVQRAGKKAFTSKEAKTPLATYSATFTKAMRNRPGLFCIFEEKQKQSLGSCCYGFVLKHTRQDGWKIIGNAGNNHHTIHVSVFACRFNWLKKNLILCVQRYRSLWYRPYIEPGPWEKVRNIFYKMMMDRVEEEKLTSIPDVCESFYISNRRTVHGYGVFAKKRIPANTQTWLYYMGGIFKAWEKKDHPTKISYRFAINGLPYLVIDPTDEDGNLSDEARKRFVCANVNEARGSQRANCFFTFNVYNRWQIFIQIGKHDIYPGQELLVESYGSQDIDPQRKQWCFENRKTKKQKNQSHVNWISPI